MRWPLRLAQLSEYQGDLIAASNYLDSAERLGANRFLLEIYRGNILERDGNLESALQHYRNALVIAPQGPGAQYAIARILSIMKRYEEAREWYRKVPPESELFVEATYGEGVAAYYLGDYESSIAAWNKVIATRPSFKEARRQLLRLYAKLRRWRDVISTTAAYVRWYRD